MTNKGNIGHQIVFTKKQEAKAKSIISNFYEQARKRDTLPNTFLLLIQSVEDSIDNHRSLEQYELDAITFIAELLFSEMEDGDIDPELENLYHKIRGWWHIEPPYYEKLNPPKEYDED